ncbi:hypothetical protein DENSPDRAFT_855114 [Dentipellis sp. KUC8613]|nr:hypothetical protein DENSPDRAFT_855114 [Dentipellis sp. KUC8613]
MESNRWRMRYKPKAILKDFKPFCGKPQNLYKHLGKCSHVDSRVNEQARYVLETTYKHKTAAGLPSAFAIGPRIAQLPPAFTQQLVSALANSTQTTSGDVITDATPDSALPIQWTVKDRNDFDTDLCRLLISGNVAWWAVENPFWQNFFKKWIPGSSMPGRYEISGRILDQESARVVELIKKEVSGCYGTGQVDGWKNRQKLEIIGSTVNVEGHVLIQL